MLVLGILLFIPLAANAAATVPVHKHCLMTTTTKQNSAQSFGGMFGIDLPVFRIEAEYNYLNESDFHANLAMANVYFKMTSTVIKPYMGLGVGVMFNGENDKYDDADFDTSAAYQSMLGVTRFCFVQNQTAALVRQPYKSSNHLV